MWPATRWRTCRTTCAAGNLTSRSPRAPPDSRTSRRSWPRLPPGSPGPACCCWNWRPTRPGGPSAWPATRASPPCRRGPTSPDATASFTPAADIAGGPGEVKGRAFAGPGETCPGTEAGPPSSSRRSVPHGEVSAARRRTHGPRTRRRGTRRGAVGRGPSAGAGDVGQHAGEHVRARQEGEVSSRHLDPAPEPAGERPLALGRDRPVVRANHERGGRGPPRHGRRGLAERPRRLAGEAGDGPRDRGVVAVVQEQLAHVLGVHADRAVVARVHPWGRVRAAEVGQGL